MNTNQEQGDRILEMLAVRPHTSVEFAKAGILRYSARIHELRGEGIAIKGEPKHGRVWEYSL